MTTQNATLNVPDDVLAPIIQAHITKAVIEALGGREEILAGAVKFFMNVAVDNDGKPTTYNGKAWIQWQIMKCVQDAAREAIVEHIAAHKEVLKKQLAAELKKVNSPVAKQLIEAIVGGISSEETLKWRLKVECGS